MSLPADKSADPPKALSPDRASKSGEPSLKEKCAICTKKLAGHIKKPLSQRCTDKIMAEETPSLVDSLKSIIKEEVCSAIEAKMAVIPQRRSWNKLNLFLPLVVVLRSPLSAYPLDFYGPATLQFLHPPDWRFGPDTKSDWTNLAAPTNPYFFSALTVVEPNLVQPQPVSKLPPLSEVKQYLTYSHYKRLSLLVANKCWPRYVRLPPGPVQVLSSNTTDVMDVISNRDLSFGRKVLSVVVPP